MFYTCTSLESINLSSFNTNNVKNMSYMFSCCNSLKSINLSSFKINNNTKIECMFINCKSLQLLDLSLFNESNITTVISDLRHYHIDNTLIIINKHNKIKIGSNKIK